MSGLAWVVIKTATVEETTARGHGYTVSQVPPASMRSCHPDRTALATGRRCMKKRLFEVLSCRFAFKANEIRVDGR